MSGIELFHSLIVMHYIPMLLENHAHSIVTNQITLDLHLMPPFPQVSGWKIISIRPITIAFKYKYP